MFDYNSLPMVVSLPLKCSCERRLHRWAIIAQHLSDEVVLWGSKIRLGKEVNNEIIAHPVPLDMRWIAIQHYRKRSARAPTSGLSHFR